MNEAELTAWITRFIEEKLELPAGSVRNNVSFDAYGVDSFVAVNLTGELSELYDKEISPTLLYKCSTAKKLAAHIASGKA